MYNDMCMVTYADEITCALVGRVQSVRTRCDGLWKEVVGQPGGEGLDASASPTRRQELKQSMGRMDCGRLQVI